MLKYVAFWVKPGTPQRVVERSKELAREAAIRGGLETGDLRWTVTPLDTGESQHTGAFEVNDD